MKRIWIESMNSFEIQCITQGLEIDNAKLNTKIQSPIELWFDLELPCFSKIPKYDKPLAENL